jgi:hypothetical protein
VAAPTETTGPNAEENTMTSAQSIARRSALAAAALLATALTACGATDGATSLDEALALLEATAAAEAIQAKGSSSETTAAGITFSPSTVVAGQPVTVTLRFGAYPVYVGFPATALAGPRVTSTRTITLITNPYLAATTIATVTARTTSPNPAVTATATLTIVPGPLAGAAAPRVASVQLGASSVTTGTAVPAVLTLSGAAPAGGLAVQVGLSNDFIMQHIDVPILVTVPAGATSAAFTARTHLANAALTTLTDYVVANAYGTGFSGAALTVTR